MYKLASNDKGRALYATKFIPKGKVVMRCPLIKLDSRETKYISRTLLSHYIFNWGEGSCIPVGYAILMNHSATPNMGWNESDEIEFLFTALVDIQPGDELCLDYGYTPDSYKDSGVQKMVDTRLVKSRVLASVTKFDVQTVIRDHLLSSSKNLTNAQSMFIQVRKQLPDISVSLFARAWKDLISQEYLVLVSGKDYRWEDVT